MAEDFAPRVPMVPIPESPPRRHPKSFGIGPGPAERPITRGDVLFILERIATSQKNTSASAALTALDLRDELLKHWRING